MPFGIDLDKVVDRAMAQLGPLLDKGLGQFTAAVSTLDASIDANTDMLTKVHGELVKVSAFQRQILLELRKR